MISSSAAPLHGRAAQFHPTSWSLIARAVGPDDPDAELALERLCAIYWYPVYAFIRRGGKQPEEAKDLTQEFFARLLSKGWLAAADRDRGRFRSFLLTSARHFLANEHDRTQRLKRGGAYAFVSLEEAEFRLSREPAEGLAPDGAFDRQWALTLLDRVIGQIQAEFASTGRAAVFDDLKSALAGDRIEYSEVAHRLKVSEGAVRVAVHRLRQRFRELLRDEIAQTVGTDTDVDDELRHLFSVMGA